MPILLLLTACAEGTAFEEVDGSTPKPTQMDTAAAPPGPTPHSAQARRYTLRLHDAPPPLALNMNREEVAELLGDVADEIVLLELDTEPLLRNALNRIKGACGEGWRQDRPNPGLDCGLTEVGRSFGHVQGVGANESPEAKMVRLLTMTPSNSEVRGTSIAFLKVVSNLLGLGGGFAEILSENLQIARTEEFIGTDSLVQALLENLMGTHPNVTDQRYVAITLRDALEDMATVGARLGPVGEPPGILAPNFPVYGEVMGPDFRMRMEADSNLRIVDGLDLPQGIDNMVTLRVEEPLELRFEDHNAFEVTGLLDPTIDLRIAIGEHPRFVPACAGNDACQANAPGSPMGADSVWSLQPWSLERIIATAARIKYGQLRTHACYVSCDLAEISIGQGGYPPGWMHFGVALDLGPKDQYVWELLNEVAQVGLHGPNERDYAEGNANVAFTLQDVPVGITAQDITRQIRPILQGQSERIADFLLGDFAERSGHVDFFFQRTTDGRPALWFVHPIDLPEGRQYTWRQPGFFADPALASKVSLQILPADEDKVHEKWVIEPGETTLYLEDAAGEVYGLRVIAGGSDAEIEVEVWPAEPE